MGKPIDEEIELQQKRGTLLVLTGPTAAGKDALFAKLQVDDPNLVRIITTTSRIPREGESEGNPYYFIERGAFEDKIASHDFFEWVEFREHLYGTEKRTLEEALKTGKDIIWHIDAKGVKNIKQKVKSMTDRSVFVFLTAPDIEVLETRVKRDEGEGKHKHRWNPSLVKWEMEQYDDCDYLVINEEGDLEGTLSKIKGIMEAKRSEILK
ncbi:MAG TPA: hypothetical protein VHE53_00905 [Patescibacteria group bacterium]|nr:hypothetical protein [Patescibacteria group bacterium]